MNYGRIWQVKQHSLCKNVNPLTGCQNSYPAVGSRKYRKIQKSKKVSSGRLNLLMGFPVGRNTVHNSTTTHVFHNAR